MAAATGLSKSTVGRIWRAFGLKPHLVDTFKLSTDPLFVDKVRDIVGLYLNPPERAVVSVRGREIRHPGAEPDCAVAADDARDGRAAQLRLRPRRHHRLCSPPSMWLPGWSSTPSSGGTAQQSSRSFSTRSTGKCPTT